MDKLIVANWKMNGDIDLASHYKKELKGCIVCPPYPLISMLMDSFAVGAQNASFKDSGALTGEISPKLLKSLGCTYVILGHSERRVHFGESQELICEKTVCALDAGLIPIVCLRDEADFDGLEPFASRIVLAWEPSWAIGSGKTPSPQEVDVMIQLLRKKSGCPIILYGGSVNEKNIDGFRPFVDGFLIGGMSLDVDRMKMIV